MYVRLPHEKHRLLRGLVAQWETSLSEAVERMVDQTLYQCVPRYVAPAWLEEALESGLPIRRCCAVEGDTDWPADNVVRLASHR